MASAWGGWRWRLVRLVGDLAVGSASLLVAFWLRLHVPLPWTSGLLPEAKLDLLPAVWPFALLAQTLAIEFVDLYGPFRPLPRIELARRLTLAAGIAGLALLAFLFFVDRDFPRTVFLLHVAQSIVGLALFRYLMQRLHRVELRDVALVGCGAAARELALAISRHHWHGLRVRAFLPIPGEMAPPPTDAATRALGERLAGIEELAWMLERGEIEEVIFAADPADWQNAWLDRLARVRPPGAGLLLLPGPFESLIGRLRYRWVHDLPLIEVLSDSEWRLRWPIKRGFDLAAAGVLMLVTAPLLAACALAVAVSSRGPILYRQVRVGRHGRPFLLLKLRTMHEGAEASGEELLAALGDERLTPVGGWLRRSRCDELPQLWNVLRGEMSLVGPRPERPGFVERYLAELPGYSERLVVPPGLTGLAQVNGDYHSSAANKLRYDLAYLANWNLGLDLSILLRTVKIVLTSRGV